MPEALEERDGLREVHRHIAEDEQLVAEQKARLERLIDEGRDVALAREFLQMSQASMIQWREHQWAL